jgi:hypothetical protein
LISLKRTSLDQCLDTSIAVDRTTEIRHVGPKNT